MFKKNHKKNKRYFQAIAVMVGYIIGVGMFGLPYLTVRSGWLVFIILLAILGPAQYLLHLIYANMIVINRSFHRLPGYVEKYLGLKGKWAVFAAKLIGNYGALIAYIIISSIFLRQLLSQFLGENLILYASIIVGLAAIVVFNGIRAISKAELYMSALLFFVIGLMVYKGWDTIEAKNYLTIDYGNILLPYGAMLMALGGEGSLPIVGRLIKKDVVLFKSVIRISMLLSSLISALFVFVIVGVSGANTTPDALVGVQQILANGVITLVLIFGLFSIMTSIIGVAESIKETLWWDFKVNKTLSWALAIFVPYFLYLAGITDLIGVISFIGAVGGGFCAIIMLIVFLKIKKKKSKLPMFTRKPSNALVYLLIGLFVVGMIYEIVNFNLI
ncbi:hypothetical protein KAJ61_00035 [Candidatus Parcubacteria bacterium]|nr:hypothetical protein [Candidatus Parcubacteria bacterium]